MELWEMWLLLMISINTTVNILVFFLGRKFRAKK